MIKRVLMTTDPLGGVWTYSVELAQALSGAGFEVVLATMGDRPRPQQREAALRIPGVTLHESTYRLEWMDHPWGDVRKAGQWLLALEARTAPSLIHLNGYAHAVLPFCAPVVSVAHTSKLGWAKAVGSEIASSDHTLYRAAVTQGLTAAAAVVAPTRTMLEELKTHYLPELSGRVIPNGLLPTRLRTTVKRPFILSSGRLWDPAKNVSALAKAAKHVPWPIFVAGDAERTGEKSVRDLSLTWLGWLDVPALHGWLEQAHIFALPARYEPFGMAALEAGLSGCALVLADLPSLREVWGEAAIFVEPNDPAMLGNALRALILDDGLLRSMASRARKRALRFSRARMAKGYIDLYLELLTLARTRGAPQCA